MSAFTITKLVHEFGHAACVKKFGGEVHAMGITLLVFTPIPYVDATAAWALRERWKRVAVGLAGMIPELFVAGLAALIWAHTGPGGAEQRLLQRHDRGVRLHAGGLTSNPLLRFDGYYILSDLTDSPNLQPRSARHLLHLIEHYLFGGQFSTTSVRSLGEAWWLALYGIASWCTGCSSPFRSFSSWRTALRHRPVGRTGDVYRLVRPCPPWRR